MAKAKDFLQNLIREKDRDFFLGAYPFACFIIEHAACGYLDVRFRKQSQQEFMRSGTEGKCIEARELIIALPEIYTRYEPQEVLEDFTEEFRRRYGVECVSALHHNKRKLRGL